MKITTAQLKKIIKEEYDRAASIQLKEKKLEARVKFLTEEVMSELSWTPRARKTAAVRKNDLLLAESYARLLLEEMSKSDLAQATRTIEKLRAIKNVTPTAAGALDQAISNAAKDINSFVGGSFNAMRKAGSKLASFFGIKSGENPLLASLTLLNSLESAFKLLPDILKNNIENYNANSDRSPLEQAEDEEIKDTIKASFKKALAPQGVYSKIASIVGKGIPYISDVDNDIVLSILDNSSAKEVTALTKAILDGPSTTELDKVVQNQLKGGSEASQSSQESAAESPEAQQAAAIEDPIRKVSKRSDDVLGSIKQSDLRVSAISAKQDITTSLQPIIKDKLADFIKRLKDTGVSDDEAKETAKNYTLNAIIAAIGDIYKM